MNFSVFLIKFNLHFKKEKEWRIRDEKLDKAPCFLYNINQYRKKTEKGRKYVCFLPRDGAAGVSFGGRIRKGRPRVPGQNPLTGAVGFGECPTLRV